MDNGVKAAIYIYNAFTRERETDDLTSSFFSSDINTGAEFYS